MEDVDAFVTKARDNNVNKAVMVTWAGFQSGAIEVAKRHGIDLFTVSFKTGEFELPPATMYVQLTRQGVPREPPVMTFGEPTLTANFDAAWLNYEDGATAQVPNEPSQMAYYPSSTVRFTK